MHNFIIQYYYIKILKEIFHIVFRLYFLTSKLNSVYTFIRKIITNIYYFQFSYCYRKSKKIIIIIDFNFITLEKL